MSDTEKKQRHRKSTRHQKSLIREFRTEIMIALLFALGVFLLFEDMEIKSVVFQGMISMFQGLSHWFSHMISKIFGIADIFEVSDIVGIFLISIAFVLFVYRARQKAIWRYAELSACPECDGDLYHIHRNFVQRIAAALFRLKIRRYKCKSCSFDSIRIRPLNSR
ncbi:hypothetical protein HQ531_15565 [bacterium]|nr:hypothetical protein [bacterium]